MVWICFYLGCCLNSVVGFVYEDHVVCVASVSKVVNVISLPKNAKNLNSFIFYPHNIINFLELHDLGGRGGDASL